MTPLTGGAAADHPPFQSRPLLAAPTALDEFNTIRTAIIPVGCWRLDDLRFEFDSSFVRPEAVQEFQALDILRKAHPQAPLSIFGHADPVGDDAYNKQLSGRRAEAVYALLVRDSARWERLFTQPFGGDDWRAAGVVSFMLAALGFEPGVAGIKAFQAASDLTPDGVVGPSTRPVLFRAYMDAICLDASGKPYHLEGPDFLARNADPQGKGDYQGCGEFNPVLMFSAAENAEMSKPANRPERNAENAPNRRVLALLFRPGSRVNPERWPCPRAAEGFAGCQKRFFADFPIRRTFQAKRRKFEETKDTFACRFYHRLTQLSPCEGVVPPAVELVAGRLPSLFSIGKTFPKPSSIPMLREVAGRAGIDPTLRVLVIGHTDASGSDNVNQLLSFSRAAAVKALLIGDRQYFRERFDSPDPLHKWGWEEVQWMLSAIEVDGDPCYVGLVDGHCSDATHAALQSFQLANEIEVTHLCGEQTLLKLIDRYLEIVGSPRPNGSQVELLGGGEWHVPRAFGKGGGPLTGPEFDSSDLPGFRRVEVFLSAKPFRPSTQTCPAAPHTRCAAYEAWCDSVVEELAASQTFTMAIRFADLDGTPLGGLSVDLVEASQDANSPIASLTATRYGTIRLTLPRGYYGLRYNVAGQDQAAAFVIHRDEVGGMTVRLADSLAKMERMRATFDPLILP